GAPCHPPTLSPCPGLRGSRLAVTDELQQIPVGVSEVEADAAAASAGGGARADLDRDVQLREVRGRLGAGAGPFETEVSAADSWQLRARVKVRGVGVEVDAVAAELQGNDARLALAPLLFEQDFRLQHPSVEGDRLLGVPDPHRQMVELELEVQGKSSYVR